MKAMLCKEYGPPEKLVYADTEPPALGPDGVRIRVHAAGVNFPDLLIIENKYQFKPSLPFAPGGEVAGLTRGRAVPPSRARAAARGRG